MRHTFVFSTPTALLCRVWIFALQKWKLIEPIQVSFNKKSLFAGLCWGVGVALVTLAFAPILGMEYHLHFNPWSIAGNFTSNLCEELIFRGLLFFSIWKAFGSKYLAIFASGIIFGLTHEQYPWITKAYVAAIGSLLSYLTSKERNMATAIVVHDVADWILDLFL